MNYCYLIYQFIIISFNNKHYNLILMDFMAKEIFYLRKQNMK